MPFKQNLLKPFNSDTHDYVWPLYNRYSVIMEVKNMELYEKLLRMFFHCLLRLDQMKISPIK